MMKNRKFINKISSWGWSLPILFVSLVFILDPRFFTSPPLRSDDWNWLVEPQIFDPLKWINLADRRPLISFLFAIATPLFGMNIMWYYILNWLLLFTTGLVFYKIIQNSFPKFPWLALPTSLLFLIYPVNYARTWLILSPITLSLLSALCAILMLVSYSKSGKIGFLIFGNFLLLFSLGIYESSFGIMMLAALLLLIIPRDIPKKQRIWMGITLLTGAAFLVWRLFLQPEIFGVHDEYLSNVNLSISTIFLRYAQGFFIFLFNWIGPLLFGFGDRKYYVFVGIIVLISLVVVLILPKMVKRPKSNLEFPYSERKLQIQSLLKITLVGLVFWAAGYIPVISIYQPTFYGDSSRVNYSSIPGAALALTAGIACLITLIVHKRQFIGRILICAIIPLVILGMTFQVVSQNERTRIWETNKDFWQAMFKLAPDFEDKTIIVIAIPGYDDLAPFEMLPFFGDWEAQSALRVLYHNPTLFAEYYYLDLPNHPDNWSPVEVDYARYVFVRYEPQTSSLVLVADPKGLFSIPFEVTGYEPELRVIDSQPETGKYRFLIK